VPELHEQCCLVRYTLINKPAGANLIIAFAAWNEIDFAARLWNVPAEHMKMKKAHTAPLSDTALKLFEALARHERNDLIFPSELAAKMADFTLLNIIHRMDKNKNRRSERDTSTRSSIIISLT